MNLDALSKEDILDQIEKLHKIDLPDNLVQQELSIMSQGLNQEDKDLTMTLLKNTGCENLIKE